MLAEQKRLEKQQKKEDAEMKDKYAKTFKKAEKALRGEGDGMTWDDVIKHKGRFEKTDASRFIDSFLRARRSGAFKRMYERKYQKQQAKGGEPTRRMTDEGGYNEGGNNEEGNNEGGFNEGGFNEGGFNEGGFNEGGFNEGGYNEGGYNEGGYNEGGYNEGGYNGNEGGYNDNGGNDNGGGYNDNEGGYNKRGRSGRRGGGGERPFKRQKRQAVWPPRGPPEERMGGDDGGERGRGKGGKRYGSGSRGDNNVDN
jgi:hypothetical protein